MLPGCGLQHGQIHCVSVPAPGKSLKVQLQFIISVTLTLVSVAEILRLFRGLIRGKEQLKPLVKKKKIVYSLKGSWSFTSSYVSQFALEKILRKSKAANHFHASSPASCTVLEDQTTGYSVAVKLYNLSAGQILNIPPQCQMVAPFFFWLTDFVALKQCTKRKNYFCSRVCTFLDSFSTQ